MKPWRQSWPCLLCGVIFAVAAFDACAGNQWTLRINGHAVSFWRTADLDRAEQEATDDHKPIAWIASASQVLDGKGTISQENSRGATLHAFYALRDRAILVFEDAYIENHKVLPLVDVALHTPNPHYTPPTVVFLNTNALDQVKGKY
jgi:hypothetical protein